MPKLFPFQQRHPSLRLPDRGYARRGAYLVTTVVKHRTDVLSVIDGERVSLTAVGQTVADVLNTFVQRFPTIAVDSHIIMPDHVHLIVCMSINNPHTLGKLVGALKGLSARRINALWNCTGHFWQRGYHDRVIRNATELAACQQYLVNNPRRWKDAHAEQRTDM